MDITFGWESDDDYGGEVLPAGDEDKIPLKQEEIIEICLDWKDPARWRPLKKTKDEQ